MTITEVAGQYGLSTDTLRYYERVGLIPPVQHKAGNRDYSGGRFKIQHIISVNSARNRTEYPADFWLQLWS